MVWTQHYQEPLLGSASAVPSSCGSCHRDLIVARKPSSGSTFFDLVSRAASALDHHCFLGLCHSHLGLPPTAGWIPVPLWHLDLFLLALRGPTFKPLHGSSLKWLSLKTGRF